MSISNKEIKRNSFLSALVVAETNVCVVINNFIEIPYISVVLMLVLILIFLLYNRRSMSFKPRVILSYFGLILFLVVSMFINGLDNVVSYLAYFLCFATGAMLCNSVKTDHSLILKSLLGVFSVYLTVYFLFVRDEFLKSDEYSFEQMGVAQANAFALVISIVYYLYKKEFKETKKINLLALGIMFASSYVVLFDCYTRGALVTISLALCLMFYGMIPKRMRLVFLSSALVFCYVLFMYLESFIDFLISIGGDGVRAIAKMKFMIDMDKADNGRDDLYELSISLIKNNPIMGHGVGYFESLAQGAYVHQFFLEILNEMGCIGLFLMLMPFYKKVKVVFSQRIDASAAFFIAIFSISIFPLLTSSSYWLYPPFWFCFFYVLNTWKSTSY